MSRTLLSLSLAVSLLAGGAAADVPRVAVDVAPVHSLVARVMQGVGTPELVVSPGASPHQYSLRPSQAAALQAADIVFRVGPALMPWLGDSIATLARDASVERLMEVEGTTVLPARDSALFAADADGGAHDHDHGPGVDDPHAWLSPDNAAVWLVAIADALSQADPEHAQAYADNAAAGREELAALTAEIEQTLAPVRGRNYIVFHDAYRYFEEAFQIPASGAISVSDAAAPSPGTIAAIRERVAGQGITCILSEPQFDPGLVAAVMDGTTMRTAVLDPLGAGLEPGPELYPRLLRDLATTLADCL